MNQIRVRKERGQIFIENRLMLKLRVMYYKNFYWEELELEQTESETNKIKFYGENHEIKIWLMLEYSDTDYIGYQLEFKADFQTRIQLNLELPDERDYFHIIPANIFGDNNIHKAQPGEYPILTKEYLEDIFCSPYWEFRADRASTPVSILCCKNGSAGISINPYSKGENNIVLRNGVFAELPNRFGVTLGYQNSPVTFVVKRKTGEPVGDSNKKGLASGKIFICYGKGREEVSPIIRTIYYEYREVPEYKKSFKEAARALVDAFIQVNWSDEYKNYTNKKCQVPESLQMVPWRQLAEIGWTAGGVMGYPFAVAEYVLGLDQEYFRDRKSYREIFDEIIECYNEKSGMFNDVTNPNWQPEWEPSNVNGWWAGFGLTKDCHCAYTNGSATAYLLRTLWFMKKYLNQENKKWLETALKVLDTVVELQNDSGSYGYTYSQDKREVLDWEGFAGCWFAESMAYAYMETGDTKYLESAKKALNYYHTFVKELCCFGTPMDTWKSVDQEGNLAFIRASRLVHEITKEEIYLKMLEDGAFYEYLWKYSFRTIPDVAPLKGSNWNSCGGSVTSVSNPHIHPMGMLIIKDLEYLARKTKDNYHKDRAKDSIAFMMNTLELYPEVTGYGRYGVLSERFCPSDGLLVEEFSDGTPSSTWFSYNGWAAAAALEGIVDKMLEEKSE